MKEQLKKWIGVTKELFSGWTIAFLLLFYFGLNAGYFFAISKSIFFSVLAGVIGAIAFLFIHVLNRKTQVNIHLLKELNKYSTTMAFHLGTGKNVLYALEETKKSIDKRIQKDIQKTIDILKSDGKLDTSHFKKYGLDSLDVFHQVLNIKYEKGGDSRTIFMPTNKDINFEITKRDKLYRQKSVLMTRLATMYMLAACFPLFLRFFVGSFYTQFLTFKLTVPILLLFYGYLLYRYVRAVYEKQDIRLTV